MSVQFIEIKSIKLSIEIEAHTKICENGLRGKSGWKFKILQQKTLNLFYFCSEAFEKIVGHVWK